MIKFPKVNWEKVGAYAFGGLLGGGLSALAWHMMEKHGIDPGMIFKKKIARGNISYYDPEKDPNLADLVSEVEELDVLQEDEDEDEEYDDAGDGINDNYISEEQNSEPDPWIYQIDRETWYRSEDVEDYKHAEMKYWIDDQQVSDENDSLIPKPWVLIGTDNYDALSDENADREMFVRNEELGTDFLIVRTDGSFEG